MPAMQIGLIKGESVDNNTEYRDSLPVNMFVVPRDVLETNGYLINWYGISEYATGQGVDRGAIWVSAKDLTGHYRVSGQYLIKVNTDSTVTVIGAISGSEEVSMTYSFNNLAIVADGRLYYYSPAKGLRQITDADVGAPIDITWVDGYFFLTDGENIYHSDILDEESYLPLDFGNAQTSPDPSEGIGRSEDNEVIVFGSLSIESFVNIGSENFAFRRITQKALKLGIMGTHCKVEMDGKWYVIGRRKESAASFHVVSLGSGNSISTRETDKIIAQYTEDDFTNATVNAMIRDNMKLVIFNLPNHTLMFNETIAEKMGLDNAWTILKSDLVGDLTYRAKNPILDPESAKWIVGDKRDSQIGLLDQSICTHYSDIVEWIIDTPFINLEGKVVHQLMLETISGISPDEDATVALSVTRNGRHYVPEHWVEMGANYDYDQRFIVRQPFGFVRHYIGIRFRGASRSRMSLANLKVVFS
jgi:hypothetical protein